MWIRTKTNCLLESYTLHIFIQIKLLLIKQYLYLNRHYFDVHTGKVVTVETVLQLKRFCRRKKVQDFSAASLGASRIRTPCMPDSKSDTVYSYFENGLNLNILLYVEEEEVYITGQKWQEEKKMKMSVYEKFIIV